VHGSVELGFEVLVDRIGDVLLQRIGRIAVALATRKARA
jgi:hypothetical protein